MLNNRFYCPNGHRMAVGSLDMLEKIYHCMHRGDDGARCGVLLYVVAEWIGRAHGRMIVAVEVTGGEVEQIRTMSVQDILEYLELSWVGVG